METRVSVQFIRLEERSNTLITIGRSSDRSDRVKYFCSGQQDVTAEFEHAMLEPLLRLLESGEGVVRSAISDLVFEAIPRGEDFVLRASGDEENDPSPFTLTRDQAREIARATRAAMAAASRPSA